MNYPKVLVISNNSFSKTGSNGRTLGKLFEGWPIENLAQFCISTDEPDYSICKNYFLVTDKSALEGFLHLKKAKRCAIGDNINSKGNFTVASKRYFKSPLKALIRNFIWNSRRWDSPSYRDWINEFAPEVILLLNSDSIFMLKIAESLSKEKGIPIVLYNTEGFYFFKKPYMDCKKWETGCFKIYQRLYRHQFTSLMKTVAYSIYANGKLQEDYVRVFGGESLVLYTGSSLHPCVEDFNEKEPVFSYIGNLAYSRIDALIEIAEVLQSINTKFVLNVYGGYSTEIENKVKKCAGLQLKGFINYDKVVETIYKSDVLFHAESQEEKWEEALMYGFSTKIADSICSGKCFVIYSSPKIAGADYIIKTGAGWFASNKMELKKTLTMIIYDSQERSKVLSKTREIALKNHQAESNSLMLKEVLTNIIFS